MARKPFCRGGNGEMRQNYEGKSYYKLHGRISFLINIDQNKAIGTWKKSRKNQEKDDGNIKQLDKSMQE